MKQEFRTEKCNNNKKTQQIHSTAEWRRQWKMLVNSLEDGTIEIAQSKQQSEIDWGVGGSSSETYGTIQQKI